MILRTARETDDLSAVLDLMRLAFLAHEGRINPPSSLSNLNVSDLIVRTLSDELLLAFKQGALAGCMLITAQKDRLYLSKLAVHPYFQKQGISKALIKWAETQAQPLKWLELQSRVELEENHAVFKRLGFVEVRRTAHPGFSKPTSITFSKRV